jgi:tetratricopeptide (TPR) repeat protein
VAKTESDAAAHHQAGRDFLNRGKYPEAVAELSEAIRLQPRFPLALNARGFVYYLMKNYPRAIADFDRAISQDAHYVNAYHNRALAKLAGGRYARAPRWILPKSAS